ncbi:MAG: anti-sigma factor [Acidobacteria bacterium]|nr:anti-sigma factor [Acidobacteriota bacterium]MCI0623037.1 anti-sigma factor [Acidobacteriota bacterium]MCI0720634.1 anti-sigma factor [Acidobacteriota bacterium]
MSHEKLSELCSIYALGALDGEELREFEAHLKTGCPLCGQQIQEYTELVASIPEALPNVAPSQDLKSRLLAQVEREFPQRGLIDFRPPATQVVPPKPARKSGWLPWVCAAAAGIALIVSLTRVSSLNRGLSEQHERLNQQLEQLKLLQNLLSEEKEVTQFLRKPEVKITPLAGTAKSPQAAGKIVWSAQEKKALFYASNLPAPPAGKTYQLWVIADNKPVDAGVFSVDPQGNAFVKVASLSEADKAQKFAVTLEPAGGVPQPTGEMHLLGSL